MKTLKITARYVEIDSSDNQEIDVRVKVYDAEYRDLIRSCETKDIISAIGITKLLDNMDIKAVIAYLNDLGVKTEWEENL